MTSLKLCIDSLAGVSNSPVPVEVCIEQLTSTESNSFDVLEQSEAEQLLEALVKAITLAVDSGNSAVVRACLDFLAKSNKHNEWLMASTKGVITHIVSLAVRVVAGTGLVLVKDLSEHDFPSETINPFSLEAVCCEVAARFLDLILDYFHVEESPEVEEQLRDVCVLSALLLFRPSKSCEWTDEEDPEICYAIDCLDRSAAFFLCNGAEQFPALLDKLRLILHDSKHDLLKLILQAAEAGIQRSLVHFCAMLYHHKNAQNRFVFSGLRLNLNSSLRSSPNVFRSFQAIHDVSNDYSVEKIDAFCEAINDSRSNFFVAKGCLISRTNEHGADEELLGACDVEFDVLSFAVRLPNQEKLRIPYFAATDLIIDEFDSSILIRDNRRPSNGLRIQFTSSFSEEGSIGYKAVQCFKDHLSHMDSVDPLNGENEINRKMSVGVTESEELNVEPAVLISGENYRPGSKRVNGISPAELPGDVPMKPVEKVMSDDSTNPDEAKTLDRCDNGDEQDGDDSAWIYNPTNSDSDDWDFVRSQLSGSKMPHTRQSELQANDLEVSSDENEYFERIGSLVQRLLEKRAEKSRSIIKKQRCQVAQMKAVREERQQQRETQFMDMVREECNKQSEELQNLGSEIVESVQNQLNAFNSQQEKIVVDKKRWTNKIGVAKNKSAGNEKKLEKELDAAYESGVRQKKRTAEEMNGLFKGIQQLFDS